MLSVIIPARDEQESVTPTLRGAVAALGRDGADYEIVVVDDLSSDGTATAATGLPRRTPA